MQHKVVEALLAARPAGGFPDHAPEGSLESYVARFLWWHIRGAIGADEAIPNELIEHQDVAVKSSLALAMGKEDEEPPNTKRHYGWRTSARRTASNLGFAQSKPCRW